MSDPRACVFCGSSPGNDPAYGRAADALTDALVEAGYDLVYGGATCGIMGRVADRALAAGRQVIGVIPELFLGDRGAQVRRKVAALAETGQDPYAKPSQELAHPGLSELVVVKSMDERKRRMLELSDVFVTLPGGFGTLDELFEVLTLAQLGEHSKPSGILDVDGYFAPLLEWVRGAEAAGFVRAEHLDLFVVERDPVALVERLATHAMPPPPAWQRDRE